MLISGVSDWLNSAVGLWTEYIIVHITRGSPLEWGQECTVPLEYSHDLDVRLELQFTQYRELLENFRELKWEDALDDEQLSRAVYLFTAGQVRPG